MVDRAARDLLGRHVSAGCPWDAGAGEPGGEADVMAEAGDAEVAELHGAVGEPHDVGRLQIAVDHALVMGVSEGRGDLLRDVQHLGDRQRAALVVLQQLAEVTALQQLHDQVQRALVLAEVMHHRDPAVLQRGGHPRLQAEALAHHTGERGVVRDPAV
ncbi:hypothetical protein SANTM175S_09128 [Streptomyces antimycoticus]